MYFILDILAFCSVFHSWFSLLYTLYLWFGQLYGTPTQSKECIRMRLYTVIIMFIATT